MGGWACCRAPEEGLGVRLATRIVGLGLVTSVLIVANSFSQGSLMNTGEQSQDSNRQCPFFAVESSQKVEKCLHKSAHSRHQSCCHTAPVCTNKILPCLCEGVGRSRGGQLYTIATKAQAYTAQMLEHPATMEDACRISVGTRRLKLVRGFHGVLQSRHQTNQRSDKQQYTLHCGKLALTRVPDEHRRAEPRQQSPVPLFRR